MREPVPSRSGPFKVFLSYAHAQEELHARLLAHLAPLKYEGLIRVWHDQAIDGGMDWNAEILEHLEQADIVLLEISAEFLDSEYCRNVEFPLATQRQVEGTARVIPIIMTDCGWQETEIGKLQALPWEGKAVGRQGREHWDANLTEVVQELRQTLQTMEFNSQYQRRRNEIERLLATGQTRDAITRLMDLAHEFRADPNTIALMTELAERLPTRPSGPQAKELDQATSAAARQLFQDVQPKIVESTSGAHAPPGAIYERALATFIANRAKGADAGAACRCENVRIQYDNGKNTKFQLEDINLTLRRGQVTGVVGPNGSGKTTLLRMIAGELFPDGGTIRYPELEYQGGATPSLIRRRVAFVPQRPDRWYGTVAQNLERWAAIYGNRHPPENALEVDFRLQRHGLGANRNSQWHELSGGAKTQFELARALIGNPYLLVLDEPLAPLDIPAQHRFLADLRHFATAIDHALPIIISSQHVYEVEAFADQILFLQDGRPQFCGDLKELAGSQTHQICELNCRGTLDDIAYLLRDWPGSEVKAAGLYFQVRLAPGLSSGDFLSKLMRAGVPVGYFRDITGSTRVLFDQVA